MSEFPSAAWMAEFQDLANRDAELELVGQWFSTSFLLEAGDAQVVFRLERGKLVEIILQPRFDNPWSFAFRAPLEHWQNFLKPLPPPLFNEIFAMIMRVPGFRLEGNTLAAVQNARALQRFMSLMRLVGN